MLHERKTLDTYFQDILDGRKTFEVRLPGERRVYVGDSLHLIEVDKNGSRTGRIIYAEVTYILPVAAVEGLYALPPTCPLEVWGIEAIYAMKNGSTIPHGIHRES